MKLGKPEYLAKVKKLGKVEQDRLFSRMTGKLPRRLEKDKLSREEALAIQMELEDEQLQEWRDRMHELKAKENSKPKKGETPKSKSDPAKVRKAPQSSKPGKKASTSKPESEGKG